MRCDVLSCNNIKEVGDSFWCHDCRMSWRKLCLESNILESNNIAESEVNSLKVLFDKCEV